MAYSSPQNTVQKAGGVAVSEAAGARHAYEILHIGFIVLPILAGIDKFFDYLTDWDKYLAPWIPSLLHVAPHQFMQVVGGVEIVAGLLVAFRARIGAYVVAAWLAGIILNLAINPNHYWDVAVRDLGLLLSAVALGFLSSERSS